SRRSPLPGAARPPSAPGSAPARSRGCRPAGASTRAAAPQRADLAALGALGRRRLLVEPEQLAQQGKPGVAVLGVELAHAHGRLVEEAGHRSAGELLDALAVGGAQGLPAPLVL